MPSWAQAAFPMLVGISAVVVMLRIGLLPWVTALFVLTMLERMPLTLDASAWYAAQSTTVLTLVISLAAYGVLNATGRHTSMHSVGDPTR